MKNPLWAKVIRTCADPQRAKHFLGLLSETSVAAQLQQVSPEQIHLLVALFSGSQALSYLLVANPDWLPTLDLAHIEHPRRDQGLRAEVRTWLVPLLETRDYAGALAKLRQFKQREMLRIAARDLARLGDVVEITRELSDVADVCLDSVGRIVWRQFTAKFGVPFQRDGRGIWQPTPFCVLGMGKLGGQELNYSSDVDVLFVYADEGQVFKQPPAGRAAPSATLSSHQFFNRLAEAFIAEVSRMTAEGSLFRIDLRLRPEGGSGPLCRSLGSYENYYAQWGQTWERMMLIKARGVAGDTALAGEFLEMIQNFRFPRSLNENALREVAATKQRIETEVVKAGELERNVKLGRGGIREIEFVVQTLQLLHAGRQPFLQSAQTLPCLAKLASYHLLGSEDAQRLDAAYRFLRDVEHRLQMEDNLQTHTIPADPAAQQRLARLMGLASRAEFEARRREHAANVRRVYDQLLKAEGPVTSETFPSKFEGAETEWEQLLAEHRFREPEKAWRVLREFVEGPGYVHVSPRTVDVARQLLPRLFDLCLNPEKERSADGPSAGSSLLDSRGRAVRAPLLSDPDRVLTRLDSFITAYGARATLFEVWNSNPSYFELLLLLFDRSEFLAEAAIRTPDLVDDLVASGRLRQQKSAEDILRDLRHGSADADQFAWLRRYHEAEQMRLGLRDILGLVDFEQNLAELSALADACLQYALEAVMRKYKLKVPPFVILGLGKLGGCEIVYGSDLDILFVTEARPNELPRRQKWAAEIMELLSRRTEQGMVFATDARLRPDGEKGLLVNTLVACEEYYRHRAQLWEIQSLTRTRAVAGDLVVGAKFQKLAARLTDFSGTGKPVTPALSPSEGAREKPARTGPQKKRVWPDLLPACFSPDWKQKIHEMRIRIEKERTPAGQDELAIKTGRGGLMDAEFIAQTLCLDHGWREANTLRALERGLAAGVLPDAEKLMANYRQLRRLEGILRRWSYEGETVLPEEPAPFLRVAVRCGFMTAEAFRTALAGWRWEIRAVYDRFFERITAGGAGVELRKGTPPPRSPR